MGCTTCGSNAPCGCGTSSLNNPLCNCGSGSAWNNCNCGNLVPANPTPFYQCAPACQESNTQKIIIQQFGASLKVDNSWNIPTCGQSAVLHIAGLISITIGSYLWNETYGYFEVTAFDISNETVTVINHCNTGNAAAGTNVPACTEFLNAAPPAATDTSGKVCVAIDFTAPAVSACIDITLTSTTGVVAGDTVQIGSGFYRVSAVKPSNIITICNDGDGITPGTSVIARDASGNYQYCLEIISSTPCSRTAVTEGTIVVCSNVSQETLLTGPFPSDPDDRFVVVPALTSSGLLHADYIPLDAGKLRCTKLHNALNIVSGTSNYTFNVDTSIGFGIGDIMMLPTPASGLRFLVTGSDSAVPGNLTVTSTTVPGFNHTFPIGTAVCVITCCERLSNAIEIPVASSDYPGDALGTSPLSSGSLTFISAPKVFATMVNPSQEFNMEIVQNVYANLAFTITPNDATRNLCIGAVLQLDIDGGGYNNVGGKVWTWSPAASGDTSYQIEEQVVAMGVPKIVNPGGRTIFTYRVGFSWFSGGTAHATLDFCSVLGTLSGAY